MRIGFDLCGFAGQRYTGMGEYACQLLTALLALESDHEFVAIGFAGDTLLSPSAALHHHLLPRRKAGKAGALVSHQVGLPAAARALRLDLVHTPWVQVRPSSPAVPWGLPCPLVVTLHDVIPLSYYQKRVGQGLPRRLALFYALNLRLAARARQVITVSHHAAHEILAHTTVAPERLAVVHNGVAFEPSTLAGEAAAALRHALALPDEYLLYAGSYEPRKNLRTLLDAYARYRTRGGQLPLALIVERASGHKQAVLDHAAALGLGPELLYLHSLDDEAIRFVYTHAALFLFPTLYEGFGFPPLQAQRCGVPVIASPASSLPEVLGNSAFYVDPLDAPALTNAIEALLHDEPVRARLIAAGRENARRFDWAAAAQQTLALYERAA